jgi:hypothetical protein
MFAFNMCLYSTCGETCDLFSTCACACLSTIEERLATPTLSLLANILPNCHTRRIVYDHRAPPSKTQMMRRFAMPTFFNTMPPNATFTDASGLEHSLALATSSARRWQGIAEQPWVDGDEESRARALFECCIFPEDIDACLNFKQHWGRFFSSRTATPHQNRAVG